MIKDFENNFKRKSYDIEREWKNFCILNETESLKITNVEVVTSEFINFTYNDDKDNNKMMIFDDCCLLSNGFDFEITDKGAFVLFYANCEDDN